MNAATALVVSGRTGLLERGRTGDVAVFRYYSGNPYRAVIAAKPEDVLLTMRGGAVMFGDDRVVQVVSQACNGVTVCNAQKRVCLGEVGTTYLSLATTNQNAYPLFFCGPPPTEPVCTPMRSAAWLFSGANVLDRPLAPRDLRRGFRGRRPTRRESAGRSLCLHTALARPRFELIDLGEELQSNVQ